MGIFRQFPYSNFHDLNTNWILDKIKEMGERLGIVEQKVDDFIIETEPIIRNEVDSWLDEHPEATTTVQDNSLTEQKFTESLRLKTIKEYITPQMYGAKGDGVTDDTAAIQAALLVGVPVFFPAGIYLVSDTLHLKASIRGAVSTRMDGSSACIKAVNNFSAVYILDISNIDSTNDITIQDIDIDCNSVSGGINYHPLNRVATRIENISIRKHTNHAIYIHPENITSRAVYMNNISITGGSEIGDSSIEISENASDCAITNLTIAYNKIGMKLRSGGHRLANIHIYVGRENIADLDSYYEDTVGIDSAGDIIGDNIYIDSARKCWVCNSGIVSVGTMMVWYDSFAETSHYNDATILSTASDSGRFVVNNLTYGGVINRIASVHDMKCYIENIYFKNAQSLTILNRVLPVVDGCTRNHYLYPYVSNSKYRVFAVIKLANFNSFVSLNAGRGSVLSQISISGSAASPTITNNAVIGKMPLWYKLDGNILYLYTLPTDSVIVSNICSYYSGHLPVNIINMPSLAIIEQNDTTGLTQVT